MTGFVIIFKTLETPAPPIKVMQCYYQANHQWNHLKLITFFTKQTIQPPSNIFFRSSFSSIWYVQLAKSIDYLHLKTLIFPAAEISAQPYLPAHISASISLVNGAEACIEDEWRCAMVPLHLDNEHQNKLPSSHRSPQHSPQTSHKETCQH